MSQRTTPEDPVLAAMGEIDDYAFAGLHLHYAPARGEWYADIDTDYREEGHRRFGGIGSTAEAAALVAAHEWRVWLGLLPPEPESPCPWYLAALARLRPIRRRPILRPIKGGKE